MPCQFNLEIREKSTAFVKKKFKKMSNILFRTYPTKNVFWTFFNFFLSQIGTHKFMSTTQLTSC